MKKTIRKAMAAIVLMATCLPIAAQKEVEASVKADFVSHYMWRGVDKGGVSIQPQATVSWKGLSLSATGNTGLDKDDQQEIDLNLNYQLAGFNVGVTDYWTSGVDPENRYLYFNQDDGAHQLEANVGYTCRWGSLQAYTMFYGQDAKPEGGRAFSTYIELAVPFRLGGLDWTAKAGVTPIKSQGTRETVVVKGILREEKVNIDKYLYADGPSCVMASLRATKNLQLGSHASLPVFAELHVNPYLQKANMVFGISICPL